MSDLKVKFWKGWLDPSNMMINTDWLPHWINVAKEENNEGFDLVVFKLPKKQSNELIAKIEKFLQDELN